VLCSVDLRKRVVDLVRNQGETQSEAARRFCVSLSSVKRWLKLKTLEPAKPAPKQSRTIRANELRELVKNQPDGYLDEYAVILKSNKSTVSYNLQKLGISRKKNHAICGKKRRKAQHLQAGN
jgi:transposase